MTDKKFDLVPVTRRQSMISTNLMKKNQNNTTIFMTEKTAPEGTTWRGLPPIGGSLTRSLRNKKRPNSGRSTLGCNRLLAWKAVMLRTIKDLEGQRSLLQADM